MNFLDNLEPNDFRNGGSFNQAEMIIDQLNQALYRAFINKENTSEFIKKAVSNLFRDGSPAAPRAIVLLEAYLEMQLVS